jgi:hypothetical protein
MRMVVPPSHGRMTQPSSKRTFQPPKCRTTVSRLSGAAGEKIRKEHHSPDRSPHSVHRWNLRNPVNGRDAVLERA